MRDEELGSEDFANKFKDVGTKSIQYIKEKNKKDLMTSSSEEDEVEIEESKKNKGRSKRTRKNKSIDH